MIGYIVAGVALGTFAGVVLHRALLIWSLNRFVNRKPLRDRFVRDLRDKLRDARK